MHSLRLAAVVAFVLTLGGATTTAADPLAGTSGEGTYYLALGDSLAAGFQPIGRKEDDHMTRAGYADQLWLMARGKYRDLQLVNLACPGENTETIRLDNGRCSYEQGSQLDEALAFIESHRDQLAFITIDLGFNDFECQDGLECLFPGIDNIEARLPGILEELTTAAPGVPIVGMNIYDPFLTRWFDGEQRLASQSVVAIELINEALGRVYAAVGIPVADVESAFAIDDWSEVPMARGGAVPRNLALLCERTWQCFRPSLGPDRHPNVLGFRVMAEAFARELGLDPVGVDLVDQTG